MREQGNASDAGSADRIMGFRSARGNHSPHDLPVTVSGKWFDAVCYKVDPELHLINSEKVRERAPDAAFADSASRVNANVHAPARNPERDVDIVAAVRFKVRVPCAARAIH